MLLWALHQLTICAVFLVGVVPAVVVVVTYPVREDTWCCEVTLYKLAGISAISQEVGAVGWVTAHLVRRIRTILVVVTPVPCLDARVVCLAHELIIATTTCWLVCVVTTVIHTVAYLLLRYTSPRRVAGKVTLWTFPGCWSRGHSSNDSVLQLS